jgi:RNA polymerase sigma-70 factor (ECF subfamily)
MITDPDHVLLDRILAGDQQVYAVLVDKYQAYAYTIAWKVLQRPAEAEEAAQDSFVKAYRHLASFNRQSKFSTWLYRIVFNTALGYRRKNRPTYYRMDGHPAVPAAAEGTLEKMDKHKYVTLALERLNEADRTALTLFYLQEFSLEEIAAITDLPANTLKVRIHRARLRLAEELRTLLQQEALTL